MAQEDCRGQELHEVRGRNQAGTESNLCRTGTCSGEGLMKINFDKLKIERPTLYAKIAQAIKHEYAGEREFFPDVLGAEIVTELTAWQAAPGTHEKHCPCQKCFDDYERRRNQQEKERLSLDTQTKAAAARLLQYMRGQGLKDNEHNRSKWQEFESKLPKDVALTPAIIDQ